MEIKIEINSLIKEDDKVFGILYFKDNDFFFPSSDWNDFVVIVLNWWCSGLIDLVGNRTGETELLFMDGSFSVEIESLTKDYFNLKFAIENSKIVKTDQVQKNEFLKSFLGQTNRVIRKLNELEWSTPEIEELKSNFNTLMKIVKT